ncbi:hypothetical protein 2050H1_076 [Serratia phage 2050H1]|uniref:Uncharacterized protein n=1 Tax=Serratia phage 2050H1 TaxID=2024250 RepID=A0A249Y2F4_9CAUD|nr:hypothetical protein 2050H1_076 [Serratia phage 2050H1]
MKKCTILVTGSRSINSDADMLKIHDLLDSCSDQIISQGKLLDALIHGDAVGVDRICAEWCTPRSVIPKSFPIPQDYYDKYGKGAGARRNQDMLEHLLELRAKGQDVYGLAFWDGSSNGTRDMITRMKASGLAVQVHLLGKPKSKRLI